MHASSEEGHSITRVTYFCKCALKCAFLMHIPKCTPNKLQTKKREGRKEGYYEGRKGIMKEGRIL